MPSGLRRRGKEGQEDQEGARPGVCRPPPATVPAPPLRRPASSAASCTCTHRHAKYQRGQSPPPSPARLRAPSVPLVHRRADLHSQPATGSFRKPCAPGCEARGNCNFEEGRCECPYGWGGPTLEKAVLPACQVPESPYDVANFTTGLAFTPMESALLPAPKHQSTTRERAALYCPRINRSEARLRCLAGGQPRLGRIEPNPQHPHPLGTAGLQPAIRGQPTPYHTSMRTQMHALVLG